MAAILFSWMYGDPAEHVDRLRSMQERLAVAEKEFKERERRRKSRRIKKLLKAAEARQLKGQR